jgi:hypothetical protein
MRRGGSLVIHNNVTNRMALCRWVYQPNLSDVRIPLTDAVNELWEGLLDGEERMVERGW